MASHPAASSRQHSSGDTTTVWTRTRQAFTILELIVVIVILGILALLAIPTFNAVIGRAKDSNVHSAAASFDRNVRALAAFDQAAPNRGADVITAARELFDVSMRATAGSGPAGASPAGNTVGSDTSTINATVARVQFTQDDATVCLTLGTASGAPGTVVAGGCTGFTPVVAESALFNNTGTGRTGTVASWTVPATATYRLSASGAAGGYAYLASSTTTNPGGLGATVAGDFALTAGTPLPSWSASKVATTLATTGAVAVAVAPSSSIRPPTPSCLQRAVAVAPGSTPRRSRTLSPARTARLDPILRLPAVQSTTVVSPPTAVGPTPTAPAERAILATA